MKTPHLIISILLAFVVGLWIATPTTPDYGSFQRATVHITNKHMKGGMPAYSKGSAVITPYGILTNAHVVNGNEGIVKTTLTFAGGERREGKLIRSLKMVSSTYGPVIDLALIEMPEDLKRWYPPAKISCSRPSVGTRVYAVGHPMRFRWLVTEGTVLSEHIQQYRYMMVTDALTHPGSSGGPVFDVHGNLVSLITAITKLNNHATGHTLSMPAETICEFLEDKFIEPDL